MTLSCFFDDSVPGEILKPLRVIPDRTELISTCQSHSSTAPWLAEATERQGGGRGCIYRVG